MDQNNEKAIGRDYTLGGLFKFAAAPIFTQLALSLLQSLDDGLFISRYIGPNALAAFSICMPMMMAMFGVAALLGGGAALCAAKMGEGRTEEAAGDFTALAFLSVGFGLVVTCVVHLFLEPLLRLLGATEILMPYCLPFADIVLWYFPCSLLTSLFSRFYVPAGKPQYAMITTLMNSFCNFFFDWLFVVKLELGMRGVAFANLFGMVAVLVFGFVFYSGKNCEIGFAKPTKNVAPLMAKVFRLGFPQMLTQLALSVNGFICNHVLLDVGNELAVSANTIVNNIQFMCMSCFFGLFSATSPIISYAYGARSKQKVRRILRQTVTLTGILSLIIIALYFIGSGPLVSIYLREDADPLMRSMVREGLLIAPIAFIFFGFVVCAEDSFGALQNSRIATLVTVCENVIFSNLTVLLLPKLFGMTGFWLCFPVSELLTSLVAVACALKYRDVYGYGKSGRATAFDTPADGAPQPEPAEGAAG